MSAVATLDDGEPAFSGAIAYDAAGAFNDRAGIVATASTSRKAAAV